MKSKSIIISAAWLLSLTIAYLVGAKITSSEQVSADTGDKTAAARPSYRAQASASSSSARNKTASRGSVRAGAQLDVTSIMRQNNPIERVNNLLALISRLGPDDFAQVVADFRASGLTRERMGEYSMLLHAWAKEDPLGALDYAEKNTSSPFARQSILASWAADNPSAALQWAETHHEGEGANPWFIGIIRGVVNADPRRASEIMAMMPYSRERGEALQTIIPHIARQGQEKAVAWLNAITDERLRNGATAYLAKRLASENPEATATWATSITDPEARSRAIGEVADEWAEKDVASAVAWTETLRGNEKARAASELIGEFAREDAGKASQWLDTLSGSDGYERVAHGFIWSTAREHPELALSKVPTLEQPKSQARYYQRILQNWHRNDAAAAQAWMTSNNISEEIQRRATRPRNDRRRR